MRKSAQSLARPDMTREHVDGKQHKPPSSVALALYVMCCNAHAVIN
jgi:hypothetical protein